MQDRIKQMAVEAGGVPLRENCLMADAFPWGVEMEIDALARFARLVAEDCATLVDGNAAQCSGMTAELMHSNADAIRARYAETKEP